MLKSLVHIVEAANSFSILKERQVLSNPSLANGLPFIIQGIMVGLIPPATLGHLAKSYADVFEINTTSVTLKAPHSATVSSRTEAVERVLLDLKKRDVFDCLRGWREEQYSVFGSRDQGILMRIERAAAGLLGVRTAGCHLNGYIKSPSGDLKVWVARRSYTKQTYPGMLDNMVGGGLPTGKHPTENIVKESFEEAGIPSDMASKAQAVGSVTFYLDCDRGWIPDLEYVYDLEMPADFVPKPTDGEVHEFKLMDVESVIF
jgi:8-oxo-dGTP pyrophosphatase MutT (NUDIX family)